MFRFDPKADDGLLINRSIGRITMLVVDHVVAVSEEKCIGCMACDRVCPTAAIVTVGKLARVNESLCTGCNKCIEACLDHGAISRKFLDEHVVLEIDTTRYPAERIDAFCAQARFDPNDSVCPCTGTTAREVAVAIFDGARTPDEITLQTGIRGVCSMWCTAALMRMMKVAGLEIETHPKNWRLYPKAADPRLSLWGISEEVARKYPEYRLVESRAALAAENLEMPQFPSIRRDPT